MSRVKGFTLIEIMVTIAIAAILASIALPSFQSIARSNAVKATTNDLISTINVARMQAVSTRANVEVKPAAGGWGGGWELVFANDSVEEDSDFVPNSSVGVQRTKGSGALMFLARGGLQGGEAEFTVSHDDASSISRTFCVSFFGKIKSGACS